MSHKVHVVIIYVKHGDTSNVHCIDLKHSMYTEGGLCMYET